MDSHVCGRAVDFSPNRLLQKIQELSTNSSVVSIQKIAEDLDLPNELLLSQLNVLKILEYIYFTLDERGVTLTINGKLTK